MRRNGEGTSAATPQVAAAAALWYEKYKERAAAQLAARRGGAPRPLQHRQDEGRPVTHFGNGVLQARSGRARRPARPRPVAKSGSGPTPRSVSCASSPAWAWSSRRPGASRCSTSRSPSAGLLNERLQEIVPDPRAVAALSKDEPMCGFMEAVTRTRWRLRSPCASTSRRAILRSPPASSAGAQRAQQGLVVAENLACLRRCSRRLRNPPYRRVRVYAVDPTFSGRSSTPPRSTR